MTSEHCKTAGHIRGALHKLIFLQASRAEGIKHMRPNKSTFLSSYITYMRDRSAASVQYTVRQGFRPYSSFDQIIPTMSNKSKATQVYMNIHNTALKLLLKLQQKTHSVV